VSSLLSAVAEEAQAGQNDCIPLPTVSPMCQICLHICCLVSLRNLWAAVGFFLAAILNWS